MGAGEGLGLGDISCHRSTHTLGDSKNAAGDASSIADINILRCCASTVVSSLASTYSYDEGSVKYAPLPKTWRQFGAPQFVLAWNLTEAVPHMISPPQGNSFEMKEMSWPDQYEFLTLPTRKPL